MPTLNPIHYGPYGGRDQYADYDPETIRMMKQLGIWHPALVRRSDSPEGIRENEMIQHIQQMREHQKGIDENVTARKEAREDYATQRADAAKLLEQGRNDRAKEVAELRRVAEEDRKTQGLVSGMRETYGTPTYDILKNEYLRQLKIPGVGEVKPVAGEYGPGGTKAVNVAAAPTPYPLPDRFASQRGTTLAQGLHTAPPGYDFNVNTGEFVAKSAPQFVNGRQVGGTGPAVAPVAGTLNPPTREDMMPTATDFYDIRPTTPVAAGTGVGSPFDELIRNLLPKKNVPGRIPGVRQNWEYLTPEEQRQQEIASQ